MNGLKSLQTDEIPLLQELAREIWEEHYPGIITQGQIDYMLKHFYADERIQEELQRGVYWSIYWKDSKPVGYMSCELRDEKLYLSKIYLKKSHRGKGYGREMIDLIHLIARQNGKKSVYLNVNKYNSASLEFYEKCGFQKTGEGVFDIGQGYVMDDYILTLNVD